MVIFAVFHRLFWSTWKRKSLFGLLVVPCTAKCINHTAYIGYVRWIMTFIQTQCQTTGHAPNHYHSTPTNSSKTSSSPTPISPNFCSNKWHSTLPLSYANTTVAFLVDPA